jgi:hypothetical protein
VHLGTVGGLVTGTFESRLMCCRSRSSMTRRTRSAVGATRPPCSRGIVVTTLMVVGVVALLRWLLWLRFCRWLVKQTGNPDSLQQAAVIARVYRDQR